MKPILRDENIFPVEDVLRKVLGKRYAAYRELIDTITGKDYGLALEWRFYKDGGAWLGKAIFKKKTVFWLSVWDGFFRTSFYFTEKTRDGVMDLDIDEAVKSAFAASEATGKLVPLSFKIDKKRQIKDVLAIVSYKKALK